MRHVRMPGLPFMALIAAVAIGAVAATPALAESYPPCKANQKEYYLGKYAEEFHGHNGIQCETAREHANWQSFANCPFGAPPYSEEWGPVVFCVSGMSFYKEQWKNKAQRQAWEESRGEPAPGFLSHFTTGNVTVNLKASIALRGGLEASSTEENENEDQWIGAKAAATIEPVPQRAIPLTKGVNTSLLSESELNRYNYYAHVAKETSTYATVELAGAAEQLKINVTNQLSEEGIAFVFPVKVRLSNPFLGPDCYVGSDANPIDVPFTTGQSGDLHGKAGVLTEENGWIIALWGDTLVSTEFSSPGVENCGVEGGADAAVDSALGLPSATGNSSVLNGVLKLVGAEAAEHAQNGAVS